MITHDICKALYALPSGRVVARRRQLALPMAFIIVGAVLLTLYFTLLSKNTEALGMTILVTGLATLLYGTLTIIMRMASNDTEPYDVMTGGYMKYHERYYDHAQKALLVAALKSGDMQRIDILQTSNISALTLAEYRTKDGSLRALALYEYIDYEDRLVSEVTIIDA